MLPPGFVIGKRRRIIKLTNAIQRVIREVLIYKIYSQNTLPVHQPFLLFEIHFPTTTTVGFAQCANSSGLVGSAAQFAYCTIVTKLSTQTGCIQTVAKHINAWLLMPDIKCRFIKSMCRFRPTVLPVMTCPFQIVFIAISTPGFGPAIDKKFKYKFIVVVTNLFPISCFFNQGRQICF